jgi:type VI secretion system protein ImpF
LSSSAPATRILLSLFDRLTDYEPRSRYDAPEGSWDRMRDLRQSLARDLTNLLNTRRSESDIPEELAQLNRSIAAYGIQDFTASPMDSEQIRRAVEKCVRTFEPRLTQVTVAVAVNSVARLDYRISAALRIDVRTERVVFDAALPKSTRRFQVSSP